MKVSGNNPINIGKIYSENMAKSHVNSGKAAKKCDAIEISKHGQEISKYVNMAKEISNVRIQKVNDIKNKIQNGTYRVSSEELAAKIIESVEGEK